MKRVAYEFLARRSGAPQKLWRHAARYRVAPGAIPHVPTLHAPQLSQSALRGASPALISRATFSDYAGGRGCAVRPPDDPLELEPDDPLELDPDDLDDPDEEEPEPPLRDDDAPLNDEPLEDPGVYPTPLMTFPCCVCSPRTTTTGAP